MRVLEGIEEEKKTVVKEDGEGGREGGRTEVVDAE